VFDVSFIRSHLLYDEFVHRLVRQVVHETGLDQVASEPLEAREIANRANLDPVSVIPLQWMLRFLAVPDAIEELPGGPAARYRWRGGGARLDPAPVREEQLRHDPSWKPAYTLAETVAREYPAFLRGEVAGEEVLFAPRRLRLWIDYFSNDNGLYAVNNAVGAVAVERWLPRDAGALLELGGGLGSGTVALLDRLRVTGREAAIAEYRFTEFVPAFLRRGEQAVRARRASPMRFAFEPLDMNRSFAEQGVRPASVSVVFAVNTLHVARDLEFTLGEVHRTLEPGGRLVVSECVRPGPSRPIYPDFVFNLTETFRSPRLHPVYRPGGGFLTPEQWQSALEAAGFVEVSFVPDIAEVRRQVPDFLVAAIGATRPG
jgi:SAM-dependent methyltransferase